METLLACLPIISLFHSQHQPALPTYASRRLTQKTYSLKFANIILNISYFLRETRSWFISLAISSITSLFTFSNLVSPGFFSYCLSKNKKLQYLNTRI